MPSKLKRLYSQNPQVTINPGTKSHLTNNKDLKEKPKIVLWDHLPGETTLKFDYKPNGVLEVTPRSKGLYLATHPRLDPIPMQKDLTLSLKPGESYSLFIIHKKPGSNSVDKDEVVIRVTETEAILKLLP